jgi:hypothetical protein
VDGDHYDFLSRTSTVEGRGKEPSSLETTEVPSVWSATAASASPVCIRITLTEFLDFVMTSGQSRITVVRNAKRRRLVGYDPRTDFYKPIRDCVANMHSSGRPQADLDALVAGLTDPKKIANYPELAAGFKRFIRGRELAWYAPPHADWTGGGLTVAVNPELHLDIDGQRHVVKMYLKGEKMNRQRVAIINHLLDQALRPRVGPAILGVLNVRKARLYAWAPASPGMTSLLEGEAATFAQIYRDV